MGGISWTTSQCTQAVLRHSSRRWPKPNATNFLIFAAHPHPLRQRQTPGCSNVQDSNRNRASRGLKVGVQAYDGTASPLFCHPHAGDAWRDNQSVRLSVSFHKPPSVILYPFDSTLSSASASLPSDLTNSACALKAGFRSRRERFDFAPYGDLHSRRAGFGYTCTF